MEPGSLLFNPTNLRENGREKQAQAGCLIKRLARTFLGQLLWEPGTSNTFTSQAPICSLIITSLSWVLLKQRQTQFAAKWF